MREEKGLMLGGMQVFIPQRKDKNTSEEAFCVNTEANAIGIEDEGDGLDSWIAAMNR